VTFFERLDSDKPIGKTRFLQKVHEKFASRATKDVIKSAFDAALERGHLVGERMKDAPKGQQSTLFMSKGETPVSDEERQFAFLAGIPC